MSEGRKEGRKEGKKEGRKEGKKEGKKEGRTKGRRKTSGSTCCLDLFVKWGEGVLVSQIPVRAGYWRCTSNPFLSCCGSTCTAMARYNTAQ